ncbi:MAG: iron-containing alcohol dehydrogenase [Deltaproteobacteria bacterium]
MKNFIFSNPTKIIFGRDTVDQIGRETRSYGKSALLVYGQKSIFDSGLYGRITASLQGAGLTVFEHGGVCSNPLLGHVREGIKKAKEAGVEVIVAVGGGSVIDSAKAIAAGVLVDHDVWQFFKGKKPIRQTMPLTCVLTLAASGSEMNGGMVVTNEETKQKFGTANYLLHPKTSILDPTLTFSVSKAYTAYGAIDAMAHILEFYLTAEDLETPVQDRLMEGLLQNIMTACDKVMISPNDYLARADLMWCATLALNGLTGAGLGRVSLPMHMIEHSLSALFNVPHGAGLSVVIPGWMRYNAAKDPRKTAQLAARVFNLQNKDTVRLASLGIEALKGWFQQIGGPATLRQLNISESEIDALAENAIALAKIWRVREYGKDEIAAVLQLCC